MAGEIEFKKRVRLRFQVDSEKGKNEGKERKAKEAGSKEIWSSRDTLRHWSEKTMDQLVGLDQHTPHDEQNVLEQQTAVEQEPTSDQFQPIPPDQITQEGNEVYLRQHQRHLRSSYPSCDLSEVSYHTEHTDFPGSRHSSLNTEPLTLDAEQIHDAKDQAVDVLQKAKDTDTAFKIFTKDTLKTIIGRVSMMEYYWRHGQDLKTKCEEPATQESEVKALEDQISTLVDKAQQIVETNEQLSERKSSGGNSSSVEENRPEESESSLEEDVKVKAD